MGSLFGGGGGGSPPRAPTLRQVDTSLTGPLYTESAAIGDQLAANMRSSYGLGHTAGATVGPSWEAQYLGPGALAMMGQSALPFEGQQDPQVQAIERTAGMGNVNLGSNPYQVAENLGQQFRNPLGQLQRNQNFLDTLLQQWKPPDTRLTGADLLSVAMGNAAQTAQARQAAFEAQQQAALTSAQQQGIAQAAAVGAAGQLGGAAIRRFSSPSLYSSNYYSPTPYAGLFGTGIGSGAGLPGYGYGTGDGNFFGADYSEPPTDVAPGGASSSGS